MDKKTYEEEAKKGLTQMGEEEQDSSNIEMDERHQELGVPQLGKVKTREEKRAEDIQEEVKKVKTEVGYIEMDRNSFPSKYMFYPENMKVKFRAASVEEMKNYTALNENDWIDRDQHIHQIIDDCTQINFDKKAGNYRDLSTFDKIYILFSVRDRTKLVHRRESELTQIVQCVKCGHKNSYKLDNSSLGYYDIDEGIMKYYNSNRKCFIFSHETFEKDLEIYIPTIGITEYIFKFISRKTREKRSGESGYFDKQFITHVPFLIPDWRSLNYSDLEDTDISVFEDKYINQIYRDYKDKWSYDKHMFMTDLVEMLNYGIKPHVEIKCEKCGHPNKSFVRFQSFRSFFNFSNTTSELLPNTKRIDVTQGLISPGV